MLKKARFVHILIINYATQGLIVVFSIFPMKLCVLELCVRYAARRGLGGAPLPHPCLAL